MGPADPFNASLGTAGMLNITIVVLCIGMSWWGLQQFRFEVLLKQPKSAAAKLLQIMMSIALGYQVARFFIEYFQWSIWLQDML